MDIAAIKNNICISVYIFKSLDDAQIFIESGLLGDVDLVTELPDGFGVGDSFIDNTWSKKRIPASITERTYQNLVVNTIRKSYSVNDEIKILRQYLSDLENENYASAFNTYNSFVSESKSKAKAQIYKGEKAAEFDGPSVFETQTEE